MSAYTNNHKGERVKLQGEVFNVMSNFFQIHVRKPGGYSWNTMPVVITYIGITLPPGLYEDTQVIIYGTVTGTFEGTNAFGADITQPMVNAEIIELK